MLVFKFGGASVKDATAIRNVVEIIRAHEKPLIVVISAMGKNTNALEIINQKRFQKENFDLELNQFIQFHNLVCKDLFGSDSALESVCADILQEFKYSLNEPVGPNFSEEYDKIICYGELFSTKIIQSYCLAKGLDCSFGDARKIVKTDDKFQDAKVNWKATSEAYKSVAGQNILITQGFIGSSEFGRPTSLGREGSDFSAAIFAYVSNAESVTIWKDVPGMLNADPKHFANTVKLDAISYREAIELSYYGASVIHPKTVKPLQNKEITLYIKSFEKPSEPGTIIQSSIKYDALVPSYIFKENQTLVSISPKDFSFIEEAELVEIFESSSKVGIKMNLMQNSALNFSFVFDHNDHKLDALLKLISYRYATKFNLGLKLLNVRHYDEKIIQQLTENYDILISQKTRSNVRFVLKDLES